MSSKNFFSWWSWLLKFNVFKYLGLAIMISGSLSFVYLCIYRDYSLVSGAVGVVLSLFIGFIIWINGWDPYENIIDENRLSGKLMTLKEFFGLVEWYKWLLKYSFFKYIALGIMIVGPYYFFYRIIFLGQSFNQNMIYSGISLILGVIIWIIVWDPYS